MYSENIAESNKKGSQLFPSQLRLLRVQRGWTQSDLARRLETTQITISRWEKAVSSPTPYLRQKLSELFGKSLEELGLVQNVAIDNNNDNIVERLTTTSDLPIPYLRNPFFTGREEILTQLDERLHHQKSVALTQTYAISGLGGIGKTQIALEYVYRYRHHYDTIFWVDASSHSTFVADFVMLAATLKLSEQHGEVIAAVRHWLATHTNWLLILDNLEDTRMSTEFLPRDCQGSILITTRLHTLGTLADSIEVEKMGVEDGVLFLLRRTRLLSSTDPLDAIDVDMRKLAEEIVKELDALPLALDQAAAYIEETGCGLQGYLNLYRVRRKELLQIRSMLPTDNHPQSVAATWSLSFQQVAEANPAAADLLCLLAFLHPEAVPEELIIRGAQACGPVLETITIDELAMNATLEALLRYSLIRRNPDKHELSIHRLVAAVIKDGMSQEQQRRWAERALKATNWIFPDVDLVTWKQCQRYLSHAQACIAHAETYQITSLEVARLFNQVGVYLMVDAEYEEAEKLLLQSLEIRNMLLPPEHTDIAASQNDLGRFYLGHSNYKKARQYLESALKIRQHVSGNQNFHTATTLHNIALLYYYEANYQDAEKYCQLSLHIRKNLIDLRPGDVAISLDLLAEIYTTHGMYEQAKTYYLDALKTLEEIPGAEHPAISYAQTLNNLARFYRLKGDFIQAEDLYTQALAKQEKLLGKEHPAVAQMLNNLARLYRAQGEYAKAEPMYQEALRIRKEIWDENHLDLAESYYCLAKLYFSQDKYIQAQAQCQQALDIQKLRLRPGHPNTASTLTMLARIYCALHDYNQAEKLYREVLTIRVQVFGQDHPQVAMTLNNLAEMYVEQGRCGEAEPLTQESLAIRKKRLGAEHQLLSYNYDTQADIYVCCGKYNEAEDLYYMALDIRERTLKSKHPLITRSYHKLVTLYNLMERYQDAETAANHRHV